MFIRPESYRERLPVALLTGFLGSGKTTLVNALLRDPRLTNTAVAVNEFGDVALDSQLLDGGADRTITLANGCLCCNLAGDLGDAVLRIFARREAGTLSRFARLIIEPSGLADPAPIAQAILRNPVMSRIFRLETIICTIDALFAEQHFARFAETRKQVALADRIVITKADLVDQATLGQVHAAIAALNPVAPVSEALHGAVDPAMLFPPTWLDPLASASPPRRSALFAEDAGQGSALLHGETTQAVLLRAEPKLDWRRFDSWLRGLRIGHADNLLRIKGVLNVRDCAAPLAIHGIHHVLHTPVELAGWPDGVAATRLVFLTQGLPRGLLERSWEDALPGLVAADAV